MNFLCVLSPYIFGGVQLFKLKFYIREISFLCESVASISPKSSFFLTKFYVVKCACLFHVAFGLCKTLKGSFHYYKYTLRFSFEHLNLPEIYMVYRLNKGTSVPSQ